MLFSINYKSSLKEEADEIRCPLHQLGTLFDFIQKYPDKRYNIEVEKSESFDKIVQQVNLVKEVTNNYTIRCKNIAILCVLAQEGYHAYLRYPVTDWEMFSTLQEINVTDIYIDGPLGFQCDKIKVGKKGTKIRVSPTISPNIGFSTATNENSFFIRPEDMYLYEGIVDIIDFNESNQEKEDTLFKIYKRGTFNFDLKELIPSLNMSVPNLFVNPEFAKARLNCGQRCKTPGRSCHSCQTEFILTKKILNHLDQSN